MSNITEIKEIFLEVPGFKIYHLITEKIKIEKQKRKKGEEINAFEVQKPL